MEKRTKAEPTVSMSPQGSFKTLHTSVWWFELPPASTSASMFQFARTLLRISTRGLLSPMLCVKAAALCVYVRVCMHALTCFSPLRVVHNDYPAWQRRYNNRVEGTNNRGFLAQAASSSESIRIHLWKERQIGMQKGKDTNL